MKRFTLILCFSLLLLLLMVAVPVTGASPTISSISPNIGYKGDTVTVTIKGTYFNATEGSVRLEMSGESDILDNGIDSWNTSTIVCEFKISSSREAGEWDLVVVRGEDDEEAEKSNAFTVLDSLGLTSITPTSARMNNDDVEFSITGTGLSEVTDVFLYNEDYDNITADDTYVLSATKVKGSFDLTDTEEDTYEVCVEDSSGNVECDLSFKIITDEVGSIAISSSPSGASITVDGIANGTTPNTVEDLSVGSHKIILRKSGYQEWGKMVTVEADETAEVDANLYAIATVSTTAPTYNPTTATTRVRTTVKSTIKVPTTWPSDTPATTASPVDPAVVIGAVGIGVGLFALRRS